MRARFIALLRPGARLRDRGRLPTGDHRHLTRIEQRVGSRSGAKPPILRILTGLLFAWKFARSTQFICCNSSALRLQSICFASGRIPSGQSDCVCLHFTPCASRSGLAMSDDAELRAASGQHRSPWRLCLFWRHSDWQWFPLLGRSVRGFPWSRFWRRWHSSV